jgi:hypothetical protein
VQVLARVLSGADGVLEWFDEDLAGHAEVDFERGARLTSETGDESEVLADADEIGDRCALKEGGWGQREGEALAAGPSRLGEVRSEEMRSGDRNAQQVGLQGAAEGLNFWEFGHGRGARRKRFAVVGRKWAATEAGSVR